MRKVILDFGGCKSRRDVQEYLAAQFDFPEYYGGNLDALYECLTELSEPTVAGFFASEVPWELEHYLDRVAQVMRDAEEENEYFAVIFGDYGRNTEEEQLF